MTTPGRADSLPANDLHVERIVRAPVDEWFYGIGDTRNRYLGPLLPEAGTPAAQPGDGAIGKRNGSYLWAMAASGDNLWFSSLGNGWCGWMMVSGHLTPSRNPNWACETWRSHYPDQQTPETGWMWPEGASRLQADWRPPQIFWRNRVSGLVRQARSDSPVFRHILSRSFGFRAAGSHAGVVFMASNPLVRDDDSVFLLAFDGNTGEFIDGTRIQGYVNVRRFRVLRHPDGSDALYLLLGSEMFSSAHPNHLLRWQGDRQHPFGSGKEHSATPGFAVVGDLGDAGAGAEFLQHGDRLIVTTWGGSERPAGMFLSGEMPADGFTPARPAAFEHVLDAGDFDPDPAIARSWLMGAIEEFRGKVYWGTIFPPGQGFLELAKRHPSVLLDAALGIVRAHRRTHLFRTDFTDPEHPHTELLYGEAQLWSYRDGHWSLQPNRLGLTPLFGDAGYDEYFNDYTWTMVRYRDSLYVGTFDIAGGMRAIRDDTDCRWTCYVLRTLADQRAPQAQTPGFDLLRFDDPQRPPLVLTRDGFGNPANNGIRNAIVMGDELFLGGSTYSNLDTAAGEAGWELFRITPRPTTQPATDATP